MIADKDYFIHIRMTDPAYTVQEAVVEYLCSNSKVAMSIASQLPIDNAPMDYQEFCDYLHNLGGLEAFRAGFSTGSLFRFGDSWFQPNGRGGFNSMTEKECRVWSISTICDGYVDDIIEGRFDIPSELREIIDLWGPDDGMPRSGYSISLNIRPGRAAKRSKR